MTHSAETVPPETTASDVARLFASKDIGSAVVCADGDIVGIVTESDIMRQVAGDEDVTTVEVLEFMSTPVETVPSTESITHAAELMKEFSIRRLPVVDKDELVGILTTTNLTHYMPRLRNTVLRSRGELAEQ